MHSTVVQIGDAASLQGGQDFGARLRDPVLLLQLFVGDVRLDAGDLRHEAIVRAPMSTMASTVVGPIIRIAFA